YNITLFKNQSYAFYAEFVSDIFCSVSNILFYITVLVFALQNKLPVFRKKPHTSPEGQELRRLTEQFQTGAISQEDYQARRAHIINNL
ncbi:MAG: SHOCT domain-containing protein, partial [Eubacteriales bacterium]